jgi:hypothetical protein
MSMGIQIRRQAWAAAGAAKKAAADKAAAEKAAAEKACAEKACAEKAAVDKACAEKAAAEKAATEKAATEKACADKTAVDKALADKTDADKASTAQVLSLIRAIQADLNLKAATAQAITDRKAADVYRRNSKAEQKHFMRTRKATAMINPKAAAAQPADFGCKAAAMSTLKPDGTTTANITTRSSTRRSKMRQAQTPALCTKPQVVSIATHTQQKLALGRLATSKATAATITRGGHLSKRVMPSCC